MIRYQDHLEAITAENATEKLAGFFRGWRSPATPSKHVRILENSSHIILAIDSDTEKVVGFINALSDGVQAAFIPLLEVLPEYQGQGIGTALVEKMLDKLADLPCVDLTCDASVQPFYQRLGMQPSHGMVIRRYDS